MKKYFFISVILLTIVLWFINKSMIHKSYLHEKINFEQYVFYNYNDCKEKLNVTKRLDTIELKLAFQKATKTHSAYKYSQYCDIEMKNILTGQILNIKIINLKLFKVNGVFYKN